MAILVTGGAGYIVCDIIFMDLLHSRSIFIAGPALQLIWHIDKFFLFS